MPERDLTFYIKAIERLEGLDSAQRKLEGMETITDKINKSLAKRGGFDYNKKLGFDMASASAKTFTNNLMKTEKSMAKNAKTTSFWSMNLLSFLFIGQQLQKMMTRIATTSLQAFSTVAGETNAANQAITQLGIGFRMIKISVGEALATALMPYVDTIMNIAMSVADWISQNQGLVAGIIVVGAILGFLMTQVAQFGMALNGIMNLVGLATGTGGMAGLGAAIAGILPILGIVAAAIAAFIILWKSNFGGFADFVKANFSNVVELFKTVFGTLIDIVKNVFGIVFAIFEGDWDKVFQLTWDLIKNLWKLITALGSYIMKTLANTVAFIINAITDLAGSLLKLQGKIFQILQAPYIMLKAFIKQTFAGIANTIIDTLNKLIKAANKLPGIDINLIPNVDEGLTVMEQFKQDFAQDNMIEKLGQLLLDTDLGFIGASKTNDIVSETPSATTISAAGTSSAVGPVMTAPALQIMNTFNGVGPDIGKVVNQTLNENMSVAKNYTGTGYTGN